ncbi:FAD-binding oxidoreductase [Rhizobium leguminosarum bv. trifolii]|uniref:FAD-binding oxidoreductase n=1 Tax=Rhizobium leguminosarum bv. trifolii TaxID=386 RepID=A0A3E1B3C5_RHILT|nr:FAD-binding oxidoreductase [Rhizobium leguminosarum]RFB83476.1 FAD-binding oxidoreductase [Rhizobium leguminosarum bv. trifolii]RFB84039.1 FAD-binding oxidoreductase [Rhizobium leguminosarum bv. trifolii]
MTAEDTSPDALSPDFIDSLREIVGPANLKLADAMSAIDYGVAAANLGAAAVILPADTEQVAMVVRCANRHSVSIVTHGGRTGLVGGGFSTPGQLIVSTTRLNKLQHFSEIDRVAVVGAGMTLQNLQERALRSGLEPGIDLPSRGSATIGGMVSTNAGGISAFRYGVMRHRVLGIEAVLPDGSIYSDLTQVIKNAAGYDLKQLFIGAEGTLGIVTAVAIKLEPLPAATATVLFGLPSIDAALFATRLGLAPQSGYLTAAEALWHSYFTLTSSEQSWKVRDYDSDHPVNLLLSLGGPDELLLQSALGQIYEALCDRFPDISAVVASSQAQQSQLWRLREDTDAIYRRHPAAPSFDVSVPLSAIDDYTERCLSEFRSLDPGLAPYIFGHLADGNLHIVLNASAAEFSADKIAAVETILYRDLSRIGGSFSAEHGIGAKRVGALRTTANPVKLTLMKTIKASLDRGSVFNPGKVLG